MYQDLITPAVFLEEKERKGENERGEGRAKGKGEGGEREDKREPISP